MVMTYLEPTHGVRGRDLAIGLVRLGHAGRDSSQYNGDQRERRHLEQSATRMRERHLTCVAIPIEMTAVLTSNY